MQIQISTDHNLQANEAMAAEITEVVAGTLRFYSDHITRVEVHIGDENGPKAGPDDIRCMLEARLESHQPITVTHHANTIRQAVHGAAQTLVTLIDNTLGRAQGRRRAART